MYEAFTQSESCIGEYEKHFCINKAVKIYKTFDWMVRTISYIQNTTTDVKSTSVITVNLKVS